MSERSHNSKAPANPNGVVAIIAVLLAGVVAFIAYAELNSGSTTQQSKTNFEAFDEAEPPPAPHDHGDPARKQAAPAVPDDLPKDSEIAKEMKASSRIQYFDGEGEGWARVTDPGPNASEPPPVDSLEKKGRVINDEIPEEKPQTPEWKIEKTNIIFDRMAKRLDRLDRQVAEAEQAGNAEQARHKKLLMRRTEDRLLDLERELARLRAEAERGAQGAETTNQSPTQSNDESTTDSAPSEPGTTPEDESASAEPEGP
ncbi:MAG: hypothetical protein ACQEVA_02735 [Myxococcota bacterium]